MKTEKLASDPEAIYEVLEISKFELKKESLFLEATGLTRTTGWSQASLEPRKYVQPPVDGIQEFDFVAVRPSGGSGNALTKIEGGGKLPAAPDWIRGVRVIAETNCKEELIEELQDRGDRASIRTKFSKALASAREEAANSSDIQTTATFIALCDSRVEALAIDYLSKGHPFLGFEYPESPDFELVAVVFKFGCKIGTICIKPPHFVAFVNLITRSVERIIDPFGSGLTIRTEKSSPDKEQYIVVRRTGFTGPCQVLKSDAYYLGVYSLVFGPASKVACEAFAKRNCTRNPE